MTEKTNYPNYYAVIPANVRYCKELNPNAKLLYGEISALCNQEGYCWATNKYFGELYSVDERTIQRQIELLKNKGFIQVVFENDCYKTNRKMYILHEMSYPHDKNVVPPRQKCRTPHDKNVTHNNTSNNNTNNNKEKSTTYSKRKPTKTFSIEKIINDYTDDEELTQSLFEFVDMRKQIKKPITTKSTVTRLLNKLDKLSGGDNEKKIVLLNSSIDHCWQDVYESSLKENTDDRITGEDTGEKEQNPKEERYGYLYCNV